MMTEYSCEESVNTKWVPQIMVDSFKRVGADSMELVCIEYTKAEFGFEYILQENLKEVLKNCFSKIWF